MKKLFTLLSALLCAWSIQAQTLTFKNGETGEDIVEGSTVYSTKYNELAYQILGNLTFQPEIVLKGDVSKTVHVKIVSKESQWACCAFDGNCLPVQADNDGFSVEKSGNVLNEGTDIQAEVIIGQASLSDKHVYTAEVFAWYEGDEANKVSFILVATNDESLLAIDDVQASKAHVTMQGNVMHYALNGEGVHTLYLYGLDGSMVMSRTLADSEGQVSLSSLRKGIYLYQIVGKSGSKAQGKVIVK